MEIKYLKTFKTITEEGSFSKAAERLSYTQSTVTFQIRQLEEELSVKLFEKIGRKMVLTKAGQNLLPHVNEVMLSVEKMMYTNKDIATLKGDLRVATADSFMCYKMPVIVKEFRKLAPNAHLYLSSMNCQRTKEELLADNFDLGVFYEDTRLLGNSFIAHKIDKYPLRLVASLETKKQFSDFKTRGQNLDVPFIIDEPDCIFRQIFENYLKKKDISLGRTIEIRSIPAIKKLVANNLGISYLPLFTVEDELQQKELFEIETDIKNDTITAVCAYHKNKWKSPLMELFIDLLTKSSL